MKKERAYRRGRGWGQIGLGIGAGMIAILAAVGLFSWLMEVETVGIEHMGIAAAGTLILGGFTGGVCCGRGEGTLTRSAVVAAGMILTLLLINLIVYDGALGGLLPGAAAVFGGIAAALLVRMGGREKRGKRYNRKYRNR